MTSKTELETLISSMQAAGLPVEDWQRQLDQKREQDPSFETRPFVTLTPPEHGKIKKIRPGYVETRPHPWHGNPVPRCQAAKRRSGGQQCGAFAAAGKHVCRVHGGARGIGKQTPEGRARQIASVTKHGRDTRAIRAERATKNKAMKQLDQIAKDQAGLETQARGPRGHYAKTKSKT